MKNILIDKANASLSSGIKHLLVTVLCLFLAVGSIQSSSLSEFQAPRITLNVVDKPLKEIIELIKGQTDYLFMIDTQDLDVTKKTSINLSTTSISEVMDVLLKDTSIKYALKDKHVIIYNAKSTNLVQQSITIKGRILDGTTSEPLIGASVTEKGVSNGVITNLDGEFNITVASPDAVLVFSYIGYLTQEVKVGNNSTFNVTLKENVEELDAVVVIGYGTMRKKDLTGSIVQIKPDRLANESPTNIQDLLRSGVPGLNISMDGSAKGGGDIQLRGQRSLNANNDPLIVMDGMVFYGELSEINPQDIEQIDVLKDASSAAIYGAKSANGVIIITTKKGKTERPVVRFDASVGFVDMASHRRVYDADGYLNFRSDWFDSSSGFANPSRFAKPTAENLAKYNVTLEEWRAEGKGTDEEIWLDRLALFSQEKENYLAGRTYDWYDSAFQTGIKQDYNASVSGSGEKVNYYLSFGYLNSKGLIRGDEYETFRSNVKVDATVNNFLNLGVNINFQNRTDGNMKVDWNRLITANSPYALPRDQEGNLVLKPMGTNPLNEGWNYDYERQFKDLDKGYTVLNTIITAKVKLPFNITYTFNIAPRFEWFHDRYHLSSQHPQWKEEHNGSVNREQTQRFDWSLNNTINWEYKFAGKHNVNVTLSQEAEERRRWKDRIEARDFTPTDALGFHYVQPADKLKSNFQSEDTHSTADAILGRLFYSYDDRYLATFSARRDGYSAFGTSNPRATFSSVALAWNFFNESFFKWDTMSYGKLRLSWGSNGNRDIGGVYTALANLTTGTGSYAYIGANNSLKEISMLYVERMANPNLRWERTSSWNAAIDFGFFDQRVTGSIEYYHMPTTDLIMSQSLVNITGFSNVTTNLGEVLNRGMEFSLNTINMRNKDFEWSSNLSFSLNRNQIKHLYYTYDPVTGKEIDDRDKGWFIGKDIKEIWHYKLEGIWQQDEAEEAALYGQVPGDPKVKNNPDNDKYKADGTLESVVYGNDDKEFLGSESPKFRWSLRNDFNFLKNFTASVNIYSVWGHKGKVTDYINNEYTYERQNVYVRNYWTPDNPTNKFARLGSTQRASGTPKIVDKSFIRLESISMSYNVPKALLAKYGIGGLRLYGSVRNVAVWKKEWYEWDPEVSGPLPRTYTLGASLTF